MKHLDTRPGIKGTWQVAETAIEKGMLHGRAIAVWRAAHRAHVWIDTSWLKTQVTCVRLPTRHVLRLTRLSRACR